MSAVDSRSARAPKESVRWFTFLSEALRMQNKVRGNCGGKVKYIRTNAPLPPDVLTDPNASKRTTQVQDGRKEERRGTEYAGPDNSGSTSRDGTRPGETILGEVKMGKSIRF